jgi:hypothetical protein
MSVVDVARPTTAPNPLEAAATAVERIHAARAWGPLAFVSLALYALYRLLDGDVGVLPLWGELLVIAVAVLAFGIRQGRTVGGAMAMAREHHAAGGHSDTWGSWRTCVHEAGHWGAAVAMGQNPKGAMVGKSPGGGGWCGLHRWWSDPISNAAFLYAGGMACGSQTGCSYDNNVAGAWLRTLSGDFGTNQRRAKSRASWALSVSSGLRSRVATILHQQGHHS